MPQTINYGRMLEEVKALVSEERDAVANMANISALLRLGVGDITWAGFYILKKDFLVLGPFSGKPACTRIRVSKGICGDAASKRQTVIVEDVKKFTGYIDCFAETQSEMAVPIIKNGIVFGVLDIESSSKKRFGPPEKYFFEKAAEFFKEYSDLT